MKLIKHLITALATISLLGAASCQSTESLKQFENEKVGTTASALYEADNNNCGASGYVCKNGRTCSSSRCLPAWQAIQTSGAPTHRGKAGAGTLNNRYVVFGGCDDDLNVLDSVAAYNPANDSWSNLASMNTPINQPSFTNSQYGIFAFSGLTRCNDGSATGVGLSLLPSLGTGWTDFTGLGTFNVYNDPIAWNGSTLLAYGGADNSTNGLSGGYRFDIAILTILGIPILSVVGSSSADCSLTDCARQGPFDIFFDGGVVKTWGGVPGTTNSGKQYTVSNSTWGSYTEPGTTPAFASFNTYGGNLARVADDGTRLFYLGDSGVYIYNRGNQSWGTDTESYPSGFCTEGPATWVNGEMIAWSGLCDYVNYFTHNVGGRYQPPAP